VFSNIWQQAGWSTIIYLSAITGINEELYEAAIIDGANRFNKIIHITIPGILPTIVIMLILRIGQVLNVGFEKVLLLYNPSIYESADVISTYVYRKGLEEFNWSFSTAVGLFNSVVNFGFLLTANWISKKKTDSGLW
jgi:putative aldouronate transport system permease protein